MKPSMIDRFFRRLMLRSLSTKYNEMLNYQNSFVIDVFRRDFDVSENEAREIFNETKKWLYLSAYHNLAENKDSDNEDHSLFIWGPLKIIDMMWHTFILCTEEYEMFCKYFFGYFIHHRPNAPSLDQPAHAEISEHGDIQSLQEVAHTAQPPSTPKLIREQMSFVYDCLGENTLRLWYSEFNERWSEDIIKSRFKALNRDGIDM